MALDFIDKEQLIAAAKLAKVLGHPLRIQILHLLNQQTMTVGELAHLLNVEQSSLSHTLKKMREFQLVSQRRAGKEIYYSATDSHIIETVQRLLDHEAHVLQNAPHYD